ncbi:DUF1289 domain-containing protein [Arenimonas alkanexedens]
MATPATEPASPCVRNCCLDAQDVCLGCGRRIDEITHWHTAEQHEREAILARAAQRQAVRRSPRNTD